jgi:hypothetical protein
MSRDRAQIECALLAAIDRVGRLARDLLVARRPDDAPSNLGPPMAMRSDGALLVNADYLPGSAFVGRSLWLGVVLDDAEGATFRAGLDEATQELVANLGGEMRRKLEPESDEPEGDEPGSGALDTGDDHSNPTTER